MKNKRKKFIFIIFFIILASFAGIGLYCNSIVKEPLKLEEDNLAVDVKNGEGFNSLLDRLDNKGVLKNKLFVKIYLKVTKKKVDLIPGTYSVKSNISLNELITLLETEDYNENQVSVTIPEGFNIDEMASLFEEKGLFSKEDFLNEIKSYKLPDYIKENEGRKYNLEGFLYPDTYKFSKDVTPEEVIRTMNEKFYNVFKEVCTNLGKDINDDEIDRIITIASLVEEEARLDEERPTIASVIYNRLNKNMKLEFCSTINYAWGEHIENLRNRHLQIDSPYNTYKNYGLPIGPIDNPGVKSIEAAINPDNTDYLYFMLLYNQGGKHHYSTTGEEHERVKLEEEAKQKANQ